MEDPIGLVERQPPRDGLGKTTESAAGGELDRSIRLLATVLAILRQLAAKCEPRGDSDPT